MNARWVPFCVEYLPPNEESRSSGRQGNKKRPLSTSPTKRGPPVPEIGAPVTSPKLGGPLLFLDLFACYGIFRFPDDQRYAIRDLDQAKRHLDDPTFGERLRPRCV